MSDAVLVERMRDASGMVEEGAEVETGDGALRSSIGVEAAESSARMRLGSRVEVGTRDDASGMVEEGTATATGDGALVELSIGVKATESSTEMGPRSRVVEEGTRDGASETAEEGAGEATGATGYSMGVEADSSSAEMRLGPRVAVAVESSEREIA